METLSLLPHPDHPPAEVTAVSAAIIGLDPHWLRVRWRVEGAGQVLIPPFAGKSRADGLWQRTCFELFLREPDNSAYVELNLSPSEEWAAYDFTGYREGMTNRALPRPPDCTLRRGPNMLLFDGTVPMAGLPALPWQLGISAVIEEAGGVNSLWALRHAPGKADFHTATCFAARLAAPGTA